MVMQLRHPNVWEVQLWKAHSKPKQWGPRLFFFCSKRCRRPNLIAQIQIWNANLAASCGQGDLQSYRPSYQIRCQNLKQRDEVQSWGPGIFQPSPRKASSPINTTKLVKPIKMHINMRWIRQLGKDTILGTWNYQNSQGNQLKLTTEGPLTEHEQLPSLARVLGRHSVVISGVQKDPPKFKQNLTNTGNPPLPVSSMVSVPNLTAMFHCHSWWRKG